MSADDIDQPYNVLFLCTCNAGRSIMAEALMNRLGEGRFRAFSAGCAPKGEIDPRVALILDTLGYRVSDFRSKSWDEFAEAPEMDFIFTVCDDAAGEVCPVWPGMPVTAHWGIPDPAQHTGTEAEIEYAFAEAAKQLRSRISLLTALAIEKLDRAALHSHLHHIHQTA
jgi:protein-tyrosine-phosphatase